MTLVIASCELGLIPIREHHEDAHSGTICEKGLNSEERQFCGFSVFVW
jgi:hypothetical protein